jgi:DNA-binding GntR family transcriptional regulator
LPGHHEDERLHHRKGITLKNKRLQLEDRSTLQERVTAAIREAILKRTFLPGERLVQEELAETLGVSRMPVREALRQLEAEGLVQLTPHKGAIVAPVSIDDIREIYELRALMEGYAVEKSLPNLSEQDKEELAQLVQEMDRAAKAADVKTFGELNEQFHQLLRQGCDGKRIHQYIQNLWNGYPPYVPTILPGQVEQSQKEHREMLNAIRTGDASALRMAMERHIRRTGDSLISFLSKENEQTSS